MVLMMNYISATTDNQSIKLILIKLVQLIF
jgi:hypothetical protein